MGRETDYSLGVTANHPVKRVNALVCGAAPQGPGGARGPDVRRVAHGAAPASRVRSRTRLYAALVKAKIHATCSRPR